MSSQDEIKDVSKKDEEFEKLRRKLTDVGMYEEGMNLDNMKELIKVLQESKEMHENRNSQSFQAPDSPPKNTTENNNESPKKSYANSIKKPSSSDNVDTVKENKEIKTDAFCSNENNCRSTKSLLEFQKKAFRRRKYAMDPLQGKIPENEEPLSRPINEDSETIDDFWSNVDIPIKERVEELSEFLQQLRDTWIMEKSNVVADSELEWGSPIEVGNHRFNLDRKTTTTTSTSGQYEQEPTREVMSRASKRKATTLIANISKNSDSDTEADDDSALLKKRKPQQERRKNNNDTSTDGKDVQMDVDFDKFVKTYNKPQTPSTSYSTINTANETNIIDSDVEDIFDYKDDKKSPEPQIYPRKIQPPIPGTNKARRGKGRSSGGGKGNFKGPRAKKTNNENKIDESEKNVPSLNRKETPLEIVLDCETSELQDISPQTDVKMLKMPLTERTRLSKQKLIEIENREKIKQEEYNLNEQKLEDEKNRKQDELIQKRLAEKEENEKLSKIREKHEKEMTKKWNTVLQDKSKTKSKIKDNKSLSADEIQQDLLGEDDIVICDDRPAGQSMKKNEVACPICNRSFPESDIVDHASECNQFEIEETSSHTVGKRQRKNKMICNVCRKYETANENDYFEHVQLCNEEYRGQRDAGFSTNQGDNQGNYNPERKNFNLRRRS